MRIMMLHMDDRQPGFFRNHGRIIPRMHITGHYRRFNLQQCFQTSNGLSQCIHRSQIFQIPHIRRQIESSVHADAEAVLQLSAHGQNLAFPRCRHHHRQRRITSGTPDHIRFTLVIIHYRIISTDPNLAIVRQHAITQMR